jgi:hypothetical protein
MTNGPDNLTHRRLRGLDRKLDNLIDMVRDLGSRMTAFETRMTTLEPGPRRYRLEAEEFAI